MRSILERIVLLGLVSLAVSFHLPSTERRGLEYHCGPDTFDRHEVAATVETVKGWLRSKMRTWVLNRSGGEYPHLLNDRKKEYYTKDLKPGESLILMPLVKGRPYPGGPLLDPYGNPRDVGGPPGLYRVLLLHNAHDESLQTIAVLAHGTSGKFEVVHAEWNPNTKRAALACIPKLSEVTGRQKVQGEQGGMKAASNESPREPGPKTGQKAGRVTLGLQALRGLMASKLGLQALHGLVAGKVGLDALRRLNPGKFGLQALRGIGAIAGSATMRFGSLLEAYHALGESFISRLKLSSDFGAADTGAASYGAFDGEGYIRVGGFYRQVFERPDNATHGGLDEMNRRLRKVKGKVLTRAQLYHLALHQDGDKHMGVEAYNEYLREEVSKGTLASGQTIGC
ncbi:hypothetical protein RJ55_07376 [Drechmeria coniospora]|nr:hypothetical protein RJ55_07376 [Drechmeria coniospora]